jgi:uncharacterized membrane protein (UPF0127 family)
MRFFALCLAAGFLSGCARNDNVVTNLDSLTTREVRMPNGKTIRAEVLISDENMRRGMSFRDSLPEDRGLIYWHKAAGVHPHWMYQVKIPLDIIFLDTNHQVTYVAVNCPPCTTRASDCPLYGQVPGTKYTIQINAGAAARFGVERGRTIPF